MTTIVHVIEDDKHMRTRIFTKDAVNIDGSNCKYTKEFFDFIGPISLKVKKDVIICDDDNYPINFNYDAN